MNSIFAAYIMTRFRRSDWEMNYLVLALAYSLKCLLLSNDVSYGVYVDSVNTDSYVLF